MRCLEKALKVKLPTMHTFFYSKFWKFVCCEPKSAENAPSFPSPAFDQLEYSCARFHSQLIKQRRNVKEARLWLCVLVSALARFPGNMFRRSHDTFVPGGLPSVPFSQIEPPVPNAEHPPGLKRKRFLLARWACSSGATPSEAPCC